MKTTVYLDETEYRRLKALAEAEGRSAAELIRIAVADYARRHADPVLPRSLAAGRSGDATWARRSEGELRGFGAS